MEREPFDDHKPPRLERIEPFCARVKEWLDEHEDNVVVIHCKAGKVRYGIRYDQAGRQPAACSSPHVALGVRASE